MHLFLKQKGMLKFCNLLCLGFEKGEEQVKKAAKKKKKRADASNPWDQVNRGSAKLPARNILKHWDRKSPFTLVTQDNLEHTQTQLLM